MIDQSPDIRKVRKLRYFNSSCVFVNDSFIEDKGEVPEGRSVSIWQFPDELRS